MTVDCSHRIPVATTYDVLNPSAEVRLNPLSVNEDGTFVVNKEFLQWVYDLKREIIILREKLNACYNRKR